MPTVAVTLDLSCCRCRVKLEKILCRIQEGCGFVFDKVEYEKGKVTITGTFDAIDLCCKIKCKARCFVTKVEILPSPPPSKGTKQDDNKKKKKNKKGEDDDKEKKKEEEKPEKRLIPYHTYPYPYPYPPPPTRYPPPPPRPCPYPTCRPPCGYPRDFCYEEPGCTVM